MPAASRTPQTIDAYIAGYPPVIQARLQKLRDTVRRAAPKAEETINYGVPTFTLHGNLVHFGASKNHIGFYPTPSAIEAFKEELSTYKGAKGSVQLPHDQPLPLGLITKIVKFRVKQQLAKAKPKKAK
jgi:uncharacterized protein YdhG (YjbR/CyaY superfamily)